MTPHQGNLPTMLMGTPGQHCIIPRTSSQKPQCVRLSFEGSQDRRREGHGLRCRWHLLVTEHPQYRNLISAEHPQLPSVGLDLGVMSIMRALRGLRSVSKSLQVSAAYTDGPNSMTCPTMLHLR